MAILGLAGSTVFFQNVVGQEWDPNEYIDNPFYGECPILYDNVNHPPVINDPPWPTPHTVIENTPTLTGTPNHLFCDPDQGAMMTAEIVSQPSHGTVTLSENQEQRTFVHTYTPEPEYIGKDSYSWKINDGLADSNVKVEEIEVAPPPPPPPAGERPVADAGPDQEVFEGDTVTLDGSASSDADGTIEKYHWKIEDSPEEYEDPLLSNSESAFPKFIAPEIDSPSASYLFELTVTDNVGLKGDKYVTIKVKDKGTDEVSNTNSVDSNTPPLLQSPSESTSSYPDAEAGPDQQVDEGDTVTLDGSASKGSSYGDIATFSWIQKGGFPYVTLTDSNTASPQFTAPQISEDTTLLFELTVQDEDGYSNTDEVSVTVNDAQTTD